MEQNVIHIKPKVASNTIPGAIKSHLISTQLQQTNQELARLSTWCLPKDSVQVSPRAHSFQHTSSLHPRPAQPAQVLIPAKSIQLLWKPEDITLIIPWQDAALWKNKSKIINSLSQLLQQQVASSELCDFFFLPSRQGYKRLYLSFSSRQTTDKILKARARLQLYDVTVLRNFRQLGSQMKFKLKSLSQSKGLSPLTQGRLHTKVTDPNAGSYDTSTKTALSQLIDLNIPVAPLTSSGDPSGDPSGAPSMATADQPFKAASRLNLMDMEWDITRPSSTLSPLKLSCTKPANMNSLIPTLIGKDNTDSNISSLNAKLQESIQLLSKLTDLDNVKAHRHDIISASQLPPQPSASGSISAYNSLPDIRPGAIFRNDPHFDSISKILFPNELESEGPEEELQSSLYTSAPHQPATTSSKDGQVSSSPLDSTKGKSPSKSD